MLQRIRSVISQSLLGGQSEKSVGETEDPPVMGNLFFASSAKNEEEHASDENTKIIWLTSSTENIDEHSFMKSLRSVSENILVCHSENDMLISLEFGNDENIFLVVHYITETLTTILEHFKQIDSIFLFTSKTPTEVPSNVRACCSTELCLVNALRKTYKELLKQKDAVALFKQEEKTDRDLNYDKGPFLIFQVFKSVLLRMPQTEEAKHMMVAICRDYYRDNAIELANIDVFDRTYRSHDAILWYAKESFICKMVKKAFRTSDIDTLYPFRFFIVDLSLALKKKFDSMKLNQSETVFHFYRGLKLTRKEISGYERRVGNLTTPNGYLNTTCYRNVAYEFATKTPKQADEERALLQYTLDMTVTKHIIFADIREYSECPEEGRVLFDIGCDFQIDSCTYNDEDDLWLINMSGTKQVGEVATEYINYQYAKSGESNLTLVLGHLFIEMGEYTKARKYFDTILRTAKPTDDVIACIYHNVGRAHYIKGEYERALACLYRAYDAHLNAQPARLIGAARSMNAIGIVSTKQGDMERATISFERALSLYKKSTEQFHDYIAETLINLGNIQCQQGRFDNALSSFKRAHKVYEQHVSSDHRNIVFILNNIGNIHYQQQKYDLTIQAFTKVLKMREKALSFNHPDLARTVHNLAVLYAIRGDQHQAELFFKRATQCGLPETDSFMEMIKNNTINWETARDKKKSMKDLLLIKEIERPELRL